MRLPCVGPRYEKKSVVQSLFFVGGILFLFFFKKCPVWSVSPAPPLVGSFHNNFLLLCGISAFGTAGSVLTGDVSASQNWALLSLTFCDTVITPAVDAFHLPDHRDPRVPVVAVLVIVFAEFAVPRPVRLHHVAVLQSRCSPLLFRALLTAVGRVSAHGVAAGQSGAGHLLTVDLASRTFASTDCTLDVAERRDERVPCGSWRVHFLVSFKVTAFRVFSSLLLGFHVFRLFPVITHWTALSLWLNSLGAGQGGADNRVTDDSFLLAAAGEAPVVVGRPARAVSVMLVLKETRVWVLFQLLWVSGQNLLSL